MSTPHISAAPGAFADTVLLPGDPRRAQHIAESFLDDAIEVTSVRNMSGYTGTWRGRAVSVMGSGMGIPSCLIYATELVRNYGVKRIVRVGTCGAVHGSVDIGDIVVALGAGTDSSVNRLRFGGYDCPATASWDLVRRVVDAADERSQPVRVGNVFSSDFFYHPDATLKQLLARFGVLGIDMETAGLYGAATELGAEALSVLTVSDHLATGRHMTPEDRETGLDAMVGLVLDAVAGR